MFCSDGTEESSSQALPQLSNLDSALHELGMLSTITDSRNQYLQEMRRKSFGSKPNTYFRKETIIHAPDIGIMQLNTRYVSNVTIGLRMKRSTNHRTMPYTVPERNRTKSENSDGFSEIREPTEIPLSQDIWMEHTSNYVSVLDPKIGHTLTKDKQPSLKKARSLENIRVENIDASQPSHEMEFVSSRIQKLKVME